MVISACSGAFASGKSKIGYVNVDRVFERYEKTKSASEKMELERKQRLEQRREMVEEINRMKDAADLLSDEAKKEKQEIVDRKVKQLYQYEEEIQKKNLREGRTLLQEVQDEIQEVLEIKGEQDGYDYIFIYTEDELGYRSKKYDITGEIVDMLNKRFSRQTSP
ncbi:MAG: hypothetical protein APR56_00265 [Methanosaeta sp. SDB]|nr:MAG: hypothetical protein APR56_00265 [Methanosaeta sp. SDB]